MDLVVVSNRVARAKANEPMTGGLAAALLPIVEKSGAIWVGSSGNVSNAFDKDSSLQIEPLGKGALALLDLPAAHMAATTKASPIPRYGPQCIPGPISFAFRRMTTNPIAR